MAAAAVTGARTFGIVALSIATASAVLLRWVELARGGMWHYAAASMLCAFLVVAAFVVMLWDAR